MVTRTLSHWLTSIALAVFALVAIKLLVTTSPAQGRPVAALINCSGSIQACINAANDGDTILIAAGTYTESLTLSKPVSLTGENRDTTIIHAIAGQRVLTVTGATISNSVVISGLTFTGGDVTGGWPCPTYCGGGIYANVPLGVVNSRFISNTAVYGGGLYSSGFVTLTHVDFISNSADSGGGVYANSSPVTLYGGMFDTNAAFWQGGGLATYNAGLSMTGTIFLANKTTSNISDSGGGGAAIHAGANQTILQNGRFQSNTSGGHGGGVMQISGFLVVTGTDFVDNTAVLNGGGVAAGGVILRDGRFEGNLSETGFGGGLSTAYALIAETVFISNTSLHSGGGLRIFGIGGSIVASRFENNRTTGSTYADGGGLNAFASTVGGESIKITDTQFINNIATTNGGGLALYSDINDPSRIVNSLFVSNQAADDGAAIYLNSPSITAILHTTIADVQIHPHSAIGVMNGTVGITNCIIVTHGIAINNTGGSVYEDYNLFVQNKVPDLIGVTSGHHSLIGDPKFVDPLNGDYHLRFGSAAIDRGVDAGVYTDLDGNPRPIGFGFDIGAYEYQSGHYLWLPLIRK